jgi:hypothetical protein
LWQDAQVSTSPSSSSPSPTLISGIIWLFGMKFLDKDTAAVEQAPA